MTPTTAHHLALMRLGLTVDEVAAVICRSEQTVRNHRWRASQNHPEEFEDAKRAGRAARLERARILLETGSVVS